MKSKLLNKKLNLLLAGTALSFLISPMSMADENTGWYGELSILQTDINDTDFNSSNREVEARFDNDTGYSAAVGYKFAPNTLGQLRVEAEFLSTNNDTDGITFNGNNFTGSNVDGEIKTKSLFINAKYAFDIPSETFSPYIGAGIGYSKVDSNLTYGPVANINDDDSSLVYQFLAGVDVNISNNLEGFAQYRYTKINDLDLTRVGGGPGGILSTTQDGDLSFEAISIGLRYQF